MRDHTTKTGPGRGYDTELASMLKHAGRPDRNTVRHGTRSSPAYFFASSLVIIVVFLVMVFVMILASAAHASGPLKTWDDPEVTPPARPLVQAPRHDPCGPKVRPVNDDCDDYREPKAPEEPHEPEHDEHERDI